MKLVLENISKQYKNKYAVKNLKVELTPGVYGLLGPNGSGKTTLMRIMTDILNPTGGRVILNGEDIKVMGDRYRDILGYLPQNFGIYKDFTAHRFLMYISALKGLDTRSAPKRVDELLELVNLKAVSKKKLGTFSGGMKQRIGIAQALLNDPKILILDEPTTGLDPKERIRFRNLISDMSKEVLLLKDGELIEKDSIDNILKNMENKVWSAIVEENMLNELNKDFKVGNIMRKEKGIEVRIISDEKPLPKAKVEVPRLEDLYMYYFEEEQTDEQAI
ncbi:ATP-binding cassette domain-containing protein [Clostridium estertheticum]|uniref:ATP-binding cassette domain-containing protein n=1 Tax=Clostridium estertheticum TaxID=238834 RepID=UPI0013EEA8CF|nr:ATP-binding cassette domain-containing protein [Clostridium estertheticum]MBZ9606936.1 ATP-binding cassette domain-containing protein [Clostridium estertheticum]